MEKENNPTAKTVNTPPLNTNLVDWFNIEFMPRYGKMVLYVLVAVLLAVSITVYVSKSRTGREVAENKALGRAYVLLEQGKSDSAEALLSGFVQSTHANVVQGKALLMLGKIHYQNQKYDEAIASYSKVKVNAKDLSLISSGALHGIAASHMQKGEYPKAIVALEEFLTIFMRSPVNPEERVSDNVEADLSPAVPNALWKLVLSYREVKDDAKLKATVEKLIKAYPDSREAHDATRLLAQI